MWNFLPDAEIHCQNRWNRNTRCKRTRNTSARIKFPVATKVCSLRPEKQNQRNTAFYCLPLIRDHGLVPGAFAVPLQNVSRLGMEREEEPVVSVTLWSYSFLILSRPSGLIKSFIWTVSRCKPQRGLARMVSVLVCIHNLDSAGVAWHCPRSATLGSLSLQSEVYSVHPSSWW